MEPSEHSITSKVTKKGVVTKVKANHGYSPGVTTLCKVLDNGNGYTVKFPSYSCTEPTKFLNIDYAESEYLFLAFQSIREKEGGWEL